jgi:general secretion pathway protein M
MEATLPTGRSGRLLALGITGIALALVWLILVAPILGLYGDQAIRRDRDAALLVRMEQLVGRLPDLRDRAAALAEGGGQSFTIEGVSDAVAAATLQDTLQNMASVVGGNVASFETVPAQTVGGYRRIGLKLSLHVPWTVLVNLLKSIEEAHPPMLIDELEIHALPMNNLVAGQRLEASFTVYAFRSGSPGEAR